jgi:hypothetical protein
LDWFDQVIYFERPQLTPITSAKDRSAPLLDDLLKSLQP